MTKEDLSRLTAKKVGVNLTESKELMDATFRVLANSLSLQKSVTIPHFGTFKVHTRKGHHFFNIIRSKISFSKQKYSILFHPSADYKQKLQEKLQS